MRPIIRARILKRHRAKCAHCGSLENLEIDHIIPISKGGKHDEDNMQVLCRTCNRKKGNTLNYLEYFKFDTSPEYMEVARAIEDLLHYMSLKELGNLFNYAHKLHEEYWRARGHLYPGDYDVKTGRYIQ